MVVREGHNDNMWFTNLQCVHEFPVIFLIMIIFAKRGVK